MLFKLISQHYIDDKLLPADTIIGRGKGPNGEVPAVDFNGPPSMMMLPLDAEAEAAIEKYEINKKKRPEAMTPPTQLGKDKVPLYAGGAAKTIQPDKSAQKPTLSPSQGQAPITEQARQNLDKAAAPKQELNAEKKG